MRKNVHLNIKKEANSTSDEVKAKDQPGPRRYIENPKDHQD